MIAAALVANGAKVYIASRKMKVIADTAKELSAIGPVSRRRRATLFERPRLTLWQIQGTCIPIQGDVSSKDSCYKLASDFGQRENVLHILVNK